MANTYAVITNGKVTACFIGDDTFAQAHYPGSIRIDNLTPVPGVGWTYSNGVFTAPVVTPATPPPATNPVFMKPDFMNLFTTTELATCFDFENSTTLTAAQKASIRVFMQYFNNAPTVDVTLPNTVAGVNLLASVGLITPARATAILASRN